MEEVYESETLDQLNVPESSTNELDKPIDNEFEDSEKKVR